MRYPQHPRPGQRWFWHPFVAVVCVLLTALGLTVSTEVINPTSASAAPAFVQVATNDPGGTVTSLAKAFTTNNTAGNAIIVTIGWDVTVGNPTCSDSQGNVYSSVVFTTNTTDKQAIGECHALNIKAGANTVTVTWPAAFQFRGIAISEYSGIASSYAVDGMTFNQNDGTGSWASNSTTTTVNGDLVLGLFADTNGGSGGSVTAGSGYTRRAVTSGGGNVMIEDRVQTTAAAISAAATAGGTSNYAAMIIAFKPSGSSTGLTTSTPTFVQKAVGTTATDTTHISLAFSSNNAAGNLIVVGATYDTAGTTITCSDTQGNTYTTGPSIYLTNDQQWAGSCYAPNSKAGANTVTMTTSGAANFKALHISEYSGVATVDPVDVTSANQAVGTAATDNVTSGTATTKVDGDLIWSVLEQSNASPGTVTAGTGFTKRSPAGGTGGANELNTEDKVQTTAGPVAATYTFGTATKNYEAVMIAFKPASWMNGWTYRKPITIDYTKVSSNLTNFSVLVKLTSTNFDFTKALSTGYDVRFTGSDGGSPLYFERERYVNGSSVAEFWVNVPAVSSTNNTVIYMYYGNNTAPDRSNPNSSFDTNTRAMLHLNENPTTNCAVSLQVCDSTGYNLNASANGTMTAGDSVAGKIYNGLDLDGVDDEVLFAIPSWMQSASKFTWTGWFKPKTLVDGAQGIVNYTSGTNNFAFQEGSSGAGTNTGVQVNLSNGSSAYGYTSSGLLAANTWGQWTMVYDGTQTGNANRLKFYFNGVQKTLTFSGTIPATTSSSIASLDIGYQSNWVIDNITMASTPRTAAWITAQYNSENDSLVTYGAQQSLNAAPTTPTLGSGTFDNYASTSTTPVLGSFASTDPDADAVQYEISWSTDNTFGSGVTTFNSSAGGGFTSTTYTSGASVSYTVQAANAMTNGSTYWWRVRSRDPSGSNTYSAYSAIRSVTINTSLTRDAWTQTTDAQFNTDTLATAATNGSGSVKLTTTSGSVKSTSLKWSDVPSGMEKWDKIAFSSTETTGDIKVKVYYTVSTTCDTIVSNVAIAGNSTGLDVTNSPLDISSLSTATYNELCLLASMTGSTTMPLLNDWTISFKPNLAPNTPTSLNQARNDNSNTIAVGQWTNTATIDFSAQATDQDSTDSLSLCVEARDINTGFSADLGCGTPVAYTGSPATVFYTATLPADGQYHWQARIKDNGHTSNLYSSYASFGGNSDTLPAAADLGTDVTAPTGGTVYDGTSAGVDAAYNTGALDTLSANWSGVNSNASGLSGYEYSIGTTAGGTTVKGWTSTGTTASMTATGLTLQTGATYFVNVRTTDNAGNLSTVISSNGQIVAPTLTFTLSSNVVQFNKLNASNSYTDTQALTMTTSTNAKNGYKVFASQTSPLTFGSKTIPAFNGGTYASPNTWTTSNRGFGYTTSDALVNGSNKFQNSPNCPGGAALVAPGCFAPFSSGTYDLVADDTGPVTSKAYTMSLKIQGDISTTAGTYSGIVSITAIPAF